MLTLLSLLKKIAQTRTKTSAGLASDHYMLCFGAGLCCFFQQGYEMLTETSSHFTNNSYIKKTLILLF